MKRNAGYGKICMLLAIVLVCSVFFTMSLEFVYAAQGGNGGQGGQGGSDSHDFGDMIALYRDINGVPIISESVQAVNPETGEMVDAGLCLQPLAAPGVTIINTLSGETACVPATPEESCLIPVDPYICAVIEGYESYEQSVELSRVNVARAPSSVMDRQYEDMLENMKSAKCITIDPAGRLVVTAPDTLDEDEDGDLNELVSKAVDSPLQNLAIYREMMTKGVLGDLDTPILLPDPPIGNYGFLDTAAKGLGAAADKEGKIDIDMVVYLNQILGLSLKDTQTKLPKICISFRKEVKGEMELVEKCFIDYSRYGYRRQNTYSKLPFPAYIPNGSPQEGGFEYLTLYPDAEGPDGKPLFMITDSAIGPTVFPDKKNPGAMDNGYTGGNIGGFAQASDDAREVIKFMHDHPVLGGYETAISCRGTGTTP